MTDHEEGTVAADGTQQMTSFRFGDTDTDTESENDGEQDQTTQTNDTGSENYSELDSGTGTETVTITGDATTWSLTLNGSGDADLSETDRGNDDDTTHPPSGGGGGSETDEDNAHWNDTDGGHLHESLSVQANGDDDTATIQNLSDTITGTVGFHENDGDTETDTAGPDQGSDTQTERVDGTNTISLTVTGSDAGVYAVTESESIGDGYTDGDNGSDGWDDPYQDTDPETGETIHGTDDGSDSYSGSDTGAETDTLTESGTIDSDGNYTPGGFSGTITGSAGTGGSDSGHDQIGLTGDSDGDIYGDTDSGSDGYSVTLTNTGGPDTGFSADINLSDTMCGSDTNTDSWTPTTDWTDTGRDILANADSDTATLTAHESGTIGANDSIMAGLSGDVSGLDGFGGTNTLTDDVPESDSSGCGDDAVGQINGAGGTDGYHVHVERSNGVMTALTDDERINQALNLDGTDAGRLPDDTADGSFHLGGTMRANLQQSGQLSGSAFQMGPTSGDDSVNLSGNLRNVDTDSQSGGEALKAPLHFDTWQLFGFQEVPVNSIVVVTTLADPAMHVDELDTEAAGSWAIGQFHFSDQPSLSVETTSTFDRTVHLVHPAVLFGGAANTDDGPPPVPEDVEVSGHIINTQAQWAIESLEGSGTGAGGTLITGEDEDTRAHADLFGSNTQGSLDSEWWEGTEHSLSGNKPASGVLSGNDTTTMDSGSDEYADVTTRVNDQALHAVWDTHHHDLVTTSDRAGSGGNELTSVGGRWEEQYTLTSDWSGSRGTAHYQHTGTDWARHILVDGEVGTPDQTDPANEGDWDHEENLVISGNHPLTGDEIRPGFNGDPHNPPPEQPREPQDWFEALSDFGAAVGDKVSGGLTRRIRQGLGYDDVVNYGSRAYAAGEIVGTAVDLAVSNLTPCRALGWAKAGLRALHAVQGAANTLNATDAFAQGDLIGGLESLQAARGSFGMAGRSCFPAGTPVAMEHGCAAIETICIGDMILARDEYEPTAPPVKGRVVNLYRGVAPVWELRAGGRVLRTTGAHPFWVRGKGWTEAASLHEGDELRTEDGWVRCAGVADTGQSEAVYNLEVAGGHTYFAGDPVTWGFALWAHNGGCTPIQQLSMSKKAAGQRLRRELGGVSAGQQAHHIIPWELRDHPLVKKAARGGFGINGKGNGILLSDAVHIGRHRKYTDAVRKKLDKILGKGGSPAAAASEIQKYVGQLRAGLERTTGKLR